VDERSLNGKVGTSGAGLRVERSDPALAVLEIALAPNAAGPPLYEQSSLDETFYVLEGRVTFRVGEAAFVALPGAPVLAPHGTPHSYANQYDEPARLVAVCSSSSFGSGEAPRSLIVGPRLEA
jgi:mannose-6-phosphate isomerase-like protein (cupin superfamily)